MRCGLQILVCGLLSLESVAFVLGGTRISSFSGRQRHGQHADGLRQLEPRPRTKMQAEVAGEAKVEAPEVDRRKKVVVVGAGWAGLAAAYELSKQV